MPTSSPSKSPSMARTPPAEPTVTLPATGFLRQPQVLALIPISKATLWRRVQRQTFPRPVKLSERVTAWRAEDLQSWIDRQCGE